MVPLIVIDELDSAKRSSQQRVRGRARATLRLLNDLAPAPDSAKPLAEASIDKLRPVEIRLLLDPTGHIRLPDADSELLDRAQDLATITERKPRIVTYDTGMVVRARALGMHVHRLEDDE